MSISFNLTQSTTAATATGALGSSGVDAPTSLTAEGLLLYCQTIVGDIQQDINAMMKEQIANMNRKKAISKVESEMKKYQPPKTEEEAQAVLRALDDAIDDLPEGDPTRVALEQLKGKIEGALDHLGKKVDHLGKKPPWSIPKLGLKDTWNGLMMEASNLKEGVADDAQMGLIRIQAKTASFQACFQLTSNLMSKLHQTSMATISNYK